MSILSDKAFLEARRKGAASAVSHEAWSKLRKMKKSDLAEVAMHLASRVTGEYGVSIEDGRALARLLEERKTLRDDGIL